MNDQKDMLCIFLVLVLFGQCLPVPMSNLLVCDDSRADNLHEGNIGESENFPWLGLLRVHLHEFKELKIAVTGLVLVKDNYAIGNADDVSRIPKLVFKQDSKAMFIPKTGEPWYTKPKDYMIHPEFEFSTYNTIALIELELEERTEVPFKPICWPGNFFNTSNHLYALGYTDENQLMEKTLYSLKYVKPSLCKEFYNRAGFTEIKSAPTYVQCGFATNNKKDCVWENGMALASNSSGKWTLIGFGVRGPGCSAPARFIDMSAYLPWVESATDMEQITDYRRTALGVGFRRKGDAASTNLTERPERPIAFREPYPGIAPEGLGDFKIYKLNPGKQDWFEMPLHLEEAGFLSADRCTVPKIMVYRERMRLIDPYDNRGRIEYRVTVLDRYIYNYTCIKLKIRNVFSREPVLVWFMHDIDQMEGTNFKGEGGETPSEIIKNFPLPPKYEPQEEEAPDSLWKPKKHLEAKFITDRADRSGIQNINIILGLEFVGKATMEIYVYGYPHPRFRTQTSTTTTTSTTEPTDRDHSPFFPFELSRSRDLPAKVLKEHPYELPRKKRKNRLEKAREREAERKSRRRAMRE